MVHNVGCCRNIGPCPNVGPCLIVGPCLNVGPCLDVSPCPNVGPCPNCPNVSPCLFSVVVSCRPEVLGSMLTQKGLYFGMESCCACPLHAGYVPVIMPQIRVQTTIPIPIQQTHCDSIIWATHLLLQYCPIPSPSGLSSCSVSVSGLT